MTNKPKIHDCIILEEARQEMRETYGKKAFPHKEDKEIEFIVQEDFTWYKMIYQKINETKPLKKAPKLIGNFIYTAGLGSLTCLSALVSINLLLPSSLAEGIGFIGAGFATYFFGKNTFKTADKFSDSYSGIKEDYDYLKMLKKDEIYKSIDDIL